MSAFTDLVFHRSSPLAMPVLTFPAGVLTGASVREFVTSADAQVAGQTALRERFGMEVALSCMDLSVEAEAFGCAVHFADDEIPTVLKRLVSTRAEAEALAVPAVGTGRTGVYLEVIRRLKSLPGGPPVLAGMLGPFSLAARLFGVSEALGLTIEDPELAQALVDKATRFLVDYARAFKAAGADGVVMAEPTAGLLSPRALGTFSSEYVKRVVTAVDDEGFTLMLHNCAARLIHLPFVLQSGARAFHFGRPMDLVAALGQVPSDVIVGGNLDPASLFVQGTPTEMLTAARQLLDVTKAHRNFVLSSGCDVPPKTPLANIEAFFAAARPRRDDQV